ncbi:MAG: hypothetical protein FWG39_02480 [Alphaproteobacteria bacterium]|nr:hypothetical protein [Alphaproteobacteria bacterium]
MNQISEILRFDNLLSDDFADGVSPLARFLSGRTDAVPDVPGAIASDIVAMRDALRAKFGDDKDGLDFCVAAMGRLAAKRFAGKSQGYVATNAALSRLAATISQKRPIIFTFCFGGYKNHNSPDYPEPGWAEFFAVRHIVKYLSPIIKNYKHGIIIEFETEEVAIHFNNVPQAETDKYTAAFGKLLEYFAARTGIDFRLAMARDLYPGGVSALNELIEQKIGTYEKIFSELSLGEQAKWIQRAENNFMIRGIKDYTNASPAEIAAAAKRARIINEAFLDADYALRAEWFDAENRILICGTWGFMPSASPTEFSLHIMSTASSITDFWIGTGVLDGTHKNILSKTQWDAAKGGIEYVDVDSDLKQISKNFEKIPVVK